MKYIHKPRFKSYLLFLIFLFNASFLFSQTFLPTSWDCSPSTLPSGWTTNIVNYYVSSAYYHSPPNAAKFEATGMYLTIAFTDKPDTLTYYLRGASFSGGTFTIQQSSNGTSWTAVRTFTSSNIPNNSLQTAPPFKDKLLSTTRYVRFIYTLKSSGNVAVDDINISALPPGPEASIKIKINNTVIPTGGTAIIGNASTTAIKVINTGTDSTLKVFGASFTGNDASMFSQSGIPMNIGGNDSATFNLLFTPGGADGTKTATLSITNNDPDKNPYIINLWAVKGCCATEPVSPATNLTLTEVTTYKTKVSFSAGTQQAEKYLVLKKTSPITENPIDGQTYLKGSYIGNAQVAYIGNPGSFYPSNIIADTRYYYKVFPFNGYPGYENYLTTNAASADVLTPQNMIGEYYNSINIYSPTLWKDLHNLINNHTTLNYSDYTTYLVNNFESRDTVHGNTSKKVITCAYSGENYIYSEPFAFLYFSREHVFCQSWMPTNNNTNFTSMPEYSDYHNLLPVNQDKINSYRSNYPLGKVVTVQYQYLEGKKGLDSLNNIVFEPRDKIKGDCARAMFYQILCYDGVSGNDWYLPHYISTTIPYGQNEQLLKKWHLQDPPDKWEMARNDYIHSVQNNRNPFIDHPEWVNRFGFGVFSQINENDPYPSEFNIFPNPANDVLYITQKNPSEFSFNLYDLQGKLLISIKNDKNFTSIPIDKLQAGVYAYTISRDNATQKISKLVIMK